MRFFASLTFLGLGSALLHGCGSTSSSCGDLLTCPGPDASTGGEAGQSGTGGSGATNTGGSSGKGGSGAATGGNGGKGAAGGSATGGATGAAGVTGTGGSIADAGDGGDGAPKCDERKSPAVEPCLVSDDHAIFVSKGALNGTGTKESPAGSIADGMVKARGAGLKRIIVCNATYAENVTIDDAAGALSIYGGFTCPVASGDAGADWTPTPGVHAVVAPTDGVPLKITNATSKIVVSGIDFVAADAPAAAAGQPGASSIGGIVANSMDVTLVDVNITAGKGADGADGAPGGKAADGTPMNMAPSPQSALCKNPMPLAGPAWGAAACGSQGGPGGGSFLNASGAPGLQGSPTTNLAKPVAGDGGAGANTLGDDGLHGNDGAPGASGAPGTSSDSLGPLNATTGYTPASGRPGEDGHPGQGGGGGGASMGGPTCTGATGGVGGMGGCGGGHGDSGKGGGASIALIVWDSHATLETAHLHAASGGAGGKGGDGSVGGFGADGTSGGKGSPGDNIGSGGRGGKGGDGGVGGSGSGGTGGPSFGLVFHGQKPSQLGQFTSDAKNGGNAGPGGAVGDGRLNPAANGKEGLSGAQYEVMP